MEKFGTAVLVEAEIWVFCSTDSTCPAKMPIKAPISTSDMTPQIAFS